MYLKKITALSAVFTLFILLFSTGCELMSEDDEKNSAEAGLDGIWQMMEVSTPEGTLTTPFQIGYPVPFAVFMEVKNNIHKFYGSSEYGVGYCPDTGEFDVIGDRVRVNGVEFYYEVNGATLVLEHLNRQNSITFNEAGRSDIEGAIPFYDVCEVKEFFEILE